MYNLAADDLHPDEHCNQGGSLCAAVTRLIVPSSQQHSLARPDGMDEWNKRATSTHHSSFEQIVAKSSVLSFLDNF